MNPYFNTPPVVKNLITANCIIYLATMLLPRFYWFANTYCSLYWFQNPDFHSWQFITYLFMHGSLSHLFFNMFALWMFGRTLEYELGSQRFLAYYLICGVGAALVQMAVVFFTGEFSIQLIGASGAVMGLLLAFGVMHPNSVIMLLIPPIPMKAKYFVMAYAVLELFLGWRGYSPGVAHFAHVGGMLWGWLLLRYWKSKGNIYY
ncbi:MAG: rhomboid family intramembrane serine protease [Alistipes sp.]|nr:rhomboid family intramembrane serine protease [Alistipes sp.]